MINIRFEPNVKRISISSKRKSNTNYENFSHMITKTESNSSFGKIISYINRKERKKYKRI